MVRIPDCPGPERVMSVVAADPQMVVKVIKYKYKDNCYKHKYQYKDGYIQL